MCDGIGFGCEYPDVRECVAITQKRPLTTNEYLMNSVKSEPKCSKYTHFITCHLSKLCKFQFSFRLLRGTGARPSAESMFELPANANRYTRTNEIGGIGVVNVRIHIKHNASLFDYHYISMHGKFIRRPLMKYTICQHST